MNTPNEIVIRADHVKEGDVLSVIGLDGRHENHAVRGMTALTERVGRQLALANGYSVLRYDYELVRVRRPVPTVTITVELSDEEVDRYLATGWGLDNIWPEAPQYVALQKIRDAIRAARAKETTP